MKALSLSLAPLAAIALAACGAKATTPADSGPTGPIDAGLYTLTILPPAAPATSCNPHAEQPSTFTDETIAWGLGDGGLQMVGNRIASADLDHDGYPDLIVHAIYTQERETIPAFWDGGFHNQPDGGFVRLVSVLMNRPNPAGGRMFVDNTEASGLFQIRGGSTTQFRNAQLATVGDFNNDGEPDVFSGTYLDGNNPQTDPGDRSELLTNDGRGHFTLAPQTDPGALQQNTWSTTGATFTDFDRDGRLDLLVGFWYDYYGTSYIGSQAQLYKGRGDGTFTTVTDEVGLTTDSTGSQASLVSGTNSRPSYGVAACDLDDDGSPDLLVGAYGREWNLLYQSDGLGAYFEEGQDAGFAGDMIRSYDDNQFFLCYCTVHTSEADCAGVAQPLISCPMPADSAWDSENGPLPWLNNGNTFTTMCRDMNGDGRLDLYSAIIRHWWAGNGADPSQLLLNTTDGGLIGFDRIPNATSNLIVPQPDPQDGWDEGLIFAAGVDLDNDARPDLYVGATDYAYQFGWLYNQQPDGSFQEVGEQWGLHHPCVSGLTVADFDRDGDLDVIVGSGTARDCGLDPATDPGGGGWTKNEIHIYTNNASDHSQWLEIRLRGNGTDTNTMGIGARVTVTVNGVPQVQEVQSGYGHMAMGNDIGVLFYGLGDCASVDSIEVRWPNAALKTDTWTNVPAGHLLELHEGDANVYGVVL